MNDYFSVNIILLYLKKADKYKMKIKVGLKNIKLTFQIFFLILVILLLIQGNVLGLVLCVPLIILLAGNKTWVRHHSNSGGTFRMGMMNYDYQVEVSLAARKTNKPESD